LVRAVRHCGGTAGRSYRDDDKLHRRTLPQDAGYITIDLSYDIIVARNEAFLKHVEIPVRHSTFETVWRPNRAI